MKDVRKRTGSSPSKGSPVAVEGSQDPANPRTFQTAEGQASRSTGGPGWTDKGGALIDKTMGSHPDAHNDAHKNETHANDIIKPTAPQFEKLGTLIAQCQQVSRLLEDRSQSSAIKPLSPKGRLRTLTCLPNGHVARGAYARVLRRERGNYSPGLAGLPWTKDKLPCAAKLVEIVNARRAAM